jgi:hypothetical protein
VIPTAFEDIRVCAIANAVEGIAMGARMVINQAKARRHRRGWKALGQIENDRPHLNHDLRTW